MLKYSDSKGGDILKRLSKDFVTIEFKNEKEEKIAKKAIELFDSQKTLYTELLNGKDFINVDIFPANIGDFLDDHNAIRFSIISSLLLKENNYINQAFFERPSNKDIYFHILNLFRDNIDDMSQKLLYYDLANDYFYMKDDFTYLKKYLYDDINREDLFTISRYLLKEHYDICFKGKIEFDISELKRLNINKTEFVEIMSIMEGFRKESLTNNLNNTITELQNSYNEYDQNIPSINDYEFEELVKETLIYIDPTNSLLKEYLECKENGVIEEVDENAVDYNYFIKEDNNPKIVIKRVGNIEDVITFVHEFAHYHYSKDHSLGILSEYPSIYYELKTSEYLLKKGYSVEEIKNANTFRLINNIDILTKSIPQLYAIVDNMDKDNYDISFIKKIDETGLKSQLQQQFPQASEEEINTLHEIAIYNYKIQMLDPITNNMVAFKYIVGSYFAYDAINYLKHEEVLDILDKIKMESPSIRDVITMHHMDSNTKGENPQKSKKILIKKKQV